MDRPKSLGVSPELHAYLVAHGTPPDEVQRSLIDETRALGPVAAMQIAPEQGAFLELLVRLVGARLVVEVGTFTGYSALCFARGVGPEGRVVCCDVSEEWTAIGRRHWARAGVAERIDLHLGDAAATLRAMPAGETVDLGFIDADKPSYPVYYEELLGRLRPGGLMVVDNVLWGGAVVDPAARDEQTEAIRAFNDRLASDERVEVVMLPIADGLTLARKRAQEPRMSG